MLVTIEITTADDLEYVEIVDPLSGGLEAVDPNLDRGAAGDSCAYPDYHDDDCCASCWCPQSSYYFGWYEPYYGHRRTSSVWYGDQDWWWGGYKPNCVFDERQTFADSVTFSATSVRAGTHTVSYEVRAVTAGIFTQPAAKVYSQHSLHYTSHHPIQFV